MMTVNEVCRLTGVSIRTLHYYDGIGLLVPAETTEAGYRLYDDTNLERLQQIMLFKELEFPLKDIKKIIDSPSFDKKKALEQQIKMLKLKKEHIEDLISFAEKIQMEGEYLMSFQAFDDKKLKTYADEAKKKWGSTEAFREYEEKTSDYSAETQKDLAKGLMDIFTEFGKLRGKSPESAESQAQVKKLQDYISENYYSCTKQILAGLGQMYAAGGEMTDNINAVGGKGTAEFAAEAIVFCCK